MTSLALLALDIPPPTKGGCQILDATDTALAGALLAALAVVFIYLALRPSVRRG